MILDSETETTLKNLHTAREDVYSFCSKGFLMMPDAKMFAMLEETLPQLADIAGVSDNKDMRSGVNGMQKFMSDKAKLTGAALSEYELEALRKYTTLFCLGSSIPTVESYYTSPLKLVMQESRDEMIKLFRKYKLKRSAQFKEFEDHISAELIFMAKLAHESRCALENRGSGPYEELLQEQRNFHVNHFDKWVDKFFHIVIEYDVPGEMLFKSMARFTSGFIHEDKALLEELAVIRCS